MRHGISSDCAFAQSFSSWAIRLGSGIVLLAAAAWPGLLQATSVSFAQFSQTNVGGNLFSYLDNGTNSQFGTNNGTFGGAIPVNFTYLTVNGTLPADLQGNQAAMLSMTTTSTTPYISTPIPQLSTTIGSQQYSQILSDTITITRDTPEGPSSLTNLLTVTFTGQLLGVLGGRTPQFSADTGLSYTVNYSSDFLTFNNSAEKDFSLTFSSWTNTSGGGGLALSLLDSLSFASATASGTGTFDGTATVPEPATITLGLVGLLMLAAVQFWVRPLKPALVRSQIAKREI
jgi:hypothetical protein